MFDDKLANLIKKICGDFAPELNANLHLQLWTGELLPLGQSPTGNIRIALNSPSAVKQIVRKPRLTTLFELYATREIDILGGTPLQALACWDHIAALKVVKKFRKPAFIARLVPYLFTISNSQKMSRDASFDERKVKTDIKKGRKDSELIKFHYDVSNDFYALFLDPKMVYSSAYFRYEDDTLEEAQIAKLDHICKKLRLEPGDRFLDVGCGWGALLEHAVTHYGVCGHGVTISQEQFNYCQEKFERLGLSKNITLEKKDYRSIERVSGFDKIAQIEMFEHVGFDNHEAHFLKIRELLRPRGLYLHQASTRRGIKDMDRFRKKTAYQDVITKFIFPGGELDHIGLTLTNLEEYGFEVHDVENLREHFQKTCALWAEKLAQKSEQAALEIGADRVRLWLLYFSLFSAGFGRGTTNVFQTLASKRHTGASGVPMSRADIYMPRAV